MGRRQRHTPSPDCLHVTDCEGRTTSLRDVWRNCAAFYVLPGPSLEDYPLEKLQDRGIVSMGVNNVGGHCRCSAFTMNDGTEKCHQGILFDPTIIKLLPDVRRGRTKGRIREKKGEMFLWRDEHITDCPNVFFFRRDLEFQPDQFLKTTSANGGTNDAGARKTGRAKSINTMHMGFRLLHYLGVREVYCLGLDFNMAKGRAYAFPEHRGANEMNENNHKYRIANKELAELKPHFDRAGFRVFNCNRRSGCTVFDYVPFEKAFERCKGKVPAEPFDLFGWYDPSRTSNDRSVERMAELRKSDLAQEHPPEQTDNSSSSGT